MTFDLKYRPRAQRDIKKLPRNIQKAIITTVEMLADNPRPKKAKQLKGYDNLYRVKIRKVYRIIYKIEDDILLVLIVRVGHRKDIYQQLKNS